MPTSGPENGTCQMGYWHKNGGCCFGIDDQTSLSNPLHFGFDEFVATPECAASATTNCGCFFWPSPHNNTPCELGHYAHPNGDMEEHRTTPYPLRIIIALATHLYVEFVCKYLCTRCIQRYSAG